MMDVTLFSYAGLTAFLALVGRVPTALAPLAGLCLLMLAGLVAGYTYSFALFARGLVLLGPVCAVVALWAYVCKRRALASSPLEQVEQAKQRWQAPPFQWDADHGAYGSPLALLQSQGLFLLCFTLLLYYFSWYFEGVQLSYYDEFFWGAFAKSIAHEGGFWTALSPLARDDMTVAYPPMPAVLANIFMPLQGYSEKSLALGGMALILATSSAFYHYARQRLAVPASAFLALAAGLLLRTIGAKCEGGYYMVGYADYLQNALFAAALLVAVLEQRPWRMALLLAGILPMLALCKQTGPVLCVYVLAAGGLAQALQRGHREKGAKLLAEGWKKGVGLLCAAFIFSMASHFIWSAYAARSIAQSSGSAALLNFAAALSDPMLWPSLQAYLIAAVERPLLVSPLFGWLSYGSGTVAFVLLALGLYFLARLVAGRWPLEQTLQGLLMLAGLAGWFLLHWYAAFVFFVEADLPNAACYERYIGPFVAGVFPVFLLLCCNHMRSAAHKTERKVTVLLGFLAFAMLVVTYALPWQRPALFSHSAVRDKMQAAAQFLEENTEKGSKIYFIPSDGATDEEWALRYFLMPQRSGTSLVPQSLNTGEGPRPKLKRFLVPEKDQLDLLLRQKAVDYIFIFSQDAAEEYPQFNPGKAETPWLVPLQR